MSDYTQITNFTAKDALASGDPLKIIKGSDVDAEFAAIAKAIETKANSASPTLTGTVTITGATLAGNATVSGAITASGAWTHSGTVTMSGKSMYWVKGADIASASPLVIGSDGNYFDVTGTTGFAAMTVPAGMLFMLQFDGALTLTHHATNLNLPGGANITTAAGDRLICFATAANTVHVLSFTRATSSHKVIVHTGNGHGSTNTKIRRFTTTLSSVGTAITYADSAANGGSFTINEAGIYACTYTDKYTTSATDIGITLNSAELTTNINSQTAAGAVLGTVQCTSNAYNSLTVVFVGAVNDVIRAHTDGGPNDTTFLSRFSIHKISNP